MFAIDYLKKEHEDAIKFIDRIEYECIQILNGKEIDLDFCKNVVYFIKNYMNDIHHKKEEDTLFSVMVKDLGLLGEKIVKTGMISEHQMAAFYRIQIETYISECERELNDFNRLQLLTNLMSYVNHLRRHVEKENEVVYPLAEDKLSDQAKKEVEELFNLELEKQKNAEKLKYECFNKLGIK